VQSAYQIVVEQGLAERFEIIAKALSLEDVVGFARKCGLDVDPQDGGDSQESLLK